MRFELFHFLALYLSFHIVVCFLQHLVEFFRSYFSHKRSLLVQLVMVRLKIIEKYSNQYNNYKQLYFTVIGDNKLHCDNNHINLHSTRVTSTTFARNSMDFFFFLLHKILYRKHFTVD